jgi:hypothetical protein
MKVFYRLVIPFVCVVLFLCASNTQWSRDNWNNIVEADGKGYYAYLPALFIYNDLNFTFFDSIEKKYPNPRLYYDYRVGEQGRQANKYFAGTALAIMPFFFIAHATAKCLGMEADGYSKIYPVCVNIAAIFYLLVGLYYLRKLLRIYDVSEGIISFILIAIAFATNLFYYAVCEPAMSHVYSFAFITAFIYFLHTFYEQPSKRSFLILCALYGVILLIRPVNGLIILIIPFAAIEKERFLWLFSYFRKQVTLVVAGFIIVSAIVSIQLIVYKIQTGSFWVNSYGTETFNWLSPHPIDFLISYKKGLLLYTPLVLISLAGLYVLFKNNKFQFYSLSLFLVVTVYVLSSWWSWWYGGSFGSRVCIEYYALIAILIGVTYNYLKQPWFRALYSGLIVCALLVCQIQTYQYRYYFIHWEKMDKEHYWRVFMRIDQLGKKNPNSDLLN